MSGVHLHPKLAHFILLFPWSLHPRMAHFILLFPEYHLRVNLIILVKKAKINVWHCVNLCATSFSVCHFISTIQLSYRPFCFINVKSWKSFWYNIAYFKTTKTMLFICFETFLDLISCYKNKSDCRENTITNEIKIIYNTRQYSLYSVTV